ncbi:MAG TPA: aromatic ring-hydroxylating dioxygenase subunit alpha [Acidimicrobiales bacterium]|nr:aromatic ring-hydroxylating dioxygenase subunit alpha [Acidimicrobiales bacterium]
MSSPSVEELFAGQMRGYTLSQALHLDPAVYQLELERIWRTNWLFAAHTAELRRAGDRTVFDVGDDSALVVRGEDGKLRAFHNVCRHRGSRLVDDTIATFAAALPYAGAGGRPPDPFIRCPYHQWAYRLDGSLAACGGMDRMAGFNTREHGLCPVECAEVGGLVFVRFERPPSPSGSPDIYELGQPLLPQRLEKAKVAYSQSYLVGAGWKVVWENNRECWHCHVGHPEYIRSHFDTANTASADVQQQMAARTATMVEALSGLCAGDVYDGGGLATFPSPGRAWSVHRTPLVEGFATESLDGQPVAPLMGEYKSFGVGVLRLRALPNFWCHASADHAVTTRLAPAGLDRTEVVVTWLVDEGAVEDRDYSLERLLPVWERTSEQDWQLCERNQRGIRSSGYRPGPLSDRHEANVAAFHNWYREAMAGG